jgi:hypothetical protein
MKQSAPPRLAPYLKRKDLHCDPGKKPLYYKMTKKRPCKKIPSLNLELWKDFFAKYIPKTPKIELRQAPIIR